ncbi:MAG: hypothetical protein ACTSUE_22815 [Promethearchaeota archaeon]
MSDSICLDGEFNTTYDFTYEFANTIWVDARDGREKFCRAAVRVLANASWNESAEICSDPHSKVFEFGSYSYTKSKSEEIILKHIECRLNRFSDTKDDPYLQEYHNLNTVVPKQLNVELVRENFFTLNESMVRIVSSKHNVHAIGYVFGLGLSVILVLGICYRLGCWRCLRNRIVHHKGEDEPLSVSNSISFEDRRMEDPDNDADMLFSIGETTTVQTSSDEESE